jgi:hypothetical protein
MNKFLKKNYKKIIIVCLIMLIFSNKMYENFSTSDALDAVAATEEKVNNIFTEIKENEVTLDKQLINNKGLHVKGNISLDKTKILLAGSNDDNHSISYNKDIDGPQIKGYAGIRFATADGGVKTVVSINKNKELKVHNGKICINNTCLDENHLKMLTDGFYFKQVGGKGDVHKKNIWNHTFSDYKVGPTHKDWGCGSHGEKCASKYKMQYNP